MPAYCLPLDYDDHVWRFREERAGYFHKARKSWFSIEMQDAERIDINALDPFDPVHFSGSRSPRKLTDDQFDDNHEAIRNGDTAIY